MIKPKKWTDIYPQGTKDGDEEQKFFISLARNPKFEWRSTGMITKETGLPRKRVEEIIAKYLKMGLIVASPSKEEHWAYWERVPGMLKDDSKSITDKDQDKRIDKQLGSADIITFDNVQTSSLFVAHGGLAMSELDSVSVVFDKAITLQDGDSMSCSFCMSLSSLPDNFTITGGIPTEIKIDASNVPDTISIWDFQTALGDTIREKYENEYVKVIEVSNLVTRKVDQPNDFLI